VTFPRHRHGILRHRTKSRPNRSNHGGVMTSYRFFTMVAASHVGCPLSNIRPPTKCNCGSQLGLQFEVNIDCGVLPWNCLFMLLFPLRMRIIKGKFTSGWKLTPYLDLWGRFSNSTSNFQKRSFSNKRCLLIIIIITIFISVKTIRSTNMIIYIHTQTPVTQDRNNRF